MRLFFPIWFAWMTFGGGLSAAGPDEPTAGEKLFALRVKPLLAEKCTACHGDDPANFKGGYVMRDRDSLLAGGDAYGREAVIPGDAAKSAIYAMVLREEPDFEMPPKEADKLSAEQTGWFRDWIDAGAPWPTDERIAWIQKHFAEGELVRTSGGLSEDWTGRRYRPEDLWAYRPLVRPAVPDSDQTGSDRRRHPVDSFIEVRLAKAGLPAAPEAEPVALIRRAAFGLTGLPPEPEDVAAFLADWESDADAAWERLIARLLASPHYGEQWARHWLDVARYADSSGFANDYERPNAWRYRDYVIRAFNEDKPYDRFIREQIAGDEIDPHDPECRIAVGFLRMGPWEHTGMSVARVTRQLFLDDVTDAVGQVFLAHALQCAKCHDHKFDPVPTRDYYAMQAIFATTQFAEVDTPWLPGENLAGMEEDERYHRLRHQANEAMLAGLMEKKRDYERAWFAKKGLLHQTRAEAKKAGVAEADLPPNALFEHPDEFGQERIGRKWQNRFNWEFDRYRPIAFTVYNGKTRTLRAEYNRILIPDDPLGDGEWEQSAILTGGDVFSPGVAVQPAVLSAEPGGLAWKVPEEADGRRSALADWIASPGNTLTARVIANRVWAWHFGRGLAGNPNNFGATGKKPTHPELLDWLAMELIESGWSIKHLHRVILVSDSWRRSTSHPRPDWVREKDPADELYAAFTPRRLTAEEMRDAMLAVSGEWNPEMGGIPIRPDMNLEAALQPRMIMGTFAPSYVPNPMPAQRNRRTLYAHHTRGQRDPFLEVFNQPGSELSCEIRDRSNVTPQVFTLFNSEESMDRALAMSRRVLGETRGRPKEASVTRAFHLAFGRGPSDEEMADSLAHWREMETLQEGIAHRPRILPTEVRREANEENTGQIFSFTEKLFAYRDYLTDLQPHETDARTRGFADLCLVLFNSNEFAYVY